MGFLEERADLANRVAVIVGGGGGLGRAIAVDLARAGVHLGLVDRNEQLLADTVGTAERAGVRVFSIAGDGRDPEVLARFFAQTDEAFDRLDILVNVVGGTGILVNRRRATPQAAKRMWDRTDLTPRDVDVAGLYDGFIFIALQWLEALGFCGEGESGPFVAEGNTRAGGIIPTNTDGGACNVGRRHGANFFVEVTRQLRGECGDRQLANPQVGVVSNSVGGFAACALMTAG